ncbi:probable ATP-dependent RNA helicase DDX10 [Pectinophora gossypiella]|uniref:probable ATP-dependent RNA helicase DDX10 n=1 Tax=Pectinophora gossypiella TaxID=13191 RepID=UPI00214E9DC3|nr:probable ATP-dependent RNA helicase DDX10 [Pectinophora gossypiella]
MQNKMKQQAKSQQNQGKKKNGNKLFKPRKKKSVEEDAAIQYLQAQYEKIVPDEIKTFKDFPLSQKTLKGLMENNYVTPTEIQREAIGYALQGKDILGAAKTGSGKTLAFLIPILEKLFCKKWTRMDGVGALVISPTRELAYQIYETLRKVGHLHDFSAGLIIGGQNLKFERKRMDQVNILICTPGRLLQHMDENPLFNCDNLQILVLDEADRCLDMGFETTMNAIIENLPPERQTLLFSATQTKSVKDLARLSLSFPTYVAPHEQADTVTPESLQQSYIVCEIDEKIGILWSFIKNHLKQKVIVFMATCKQVKYTYDLFCKLRPGVSLLALYGSLHQEKREKIYNEFCRKSNVVLFATDLASRGLDFPRVNWVIQMDCPEDVDTYIHRAGRTARGIFGKGEGLLMLLPHEEKFVEDLTQRKIPINKIAVDPSKVVAPQRKIEALLSDNTDLKQTAQRAFVNYVKSVFLMKNKEIFNIQLLDTDAYARSLGLIVPPRIKFMHNHQKQNVTKKQEDATANNVNVIEKLKAKVDEDEGSDQSAAEEDESPTKTKKIERKPEKKLKNKKEIPKIDFHYEEDSDEDDFLKVKKANVEVELTPIDEEQNIMSKKKAKPLTKAAVAKKILKKKIKVNTTVKFTDEGEAIDDEKRDVKSELAKQFINENVGGIDIEKAKEVLKEEDKYDKQRFREKVKAKHKEQKRKLKNKKKEEEGEKDDFGSQSESDGPDLSWLPDPDKIYGEKDGSNSDDNSQEDNRLMTADQSSIGEESEIEEKYHRPSKRKLVESRGIPQESVKPRKVKKIEDISSSLSVHEAEALAMQLLQAKR